MEYTTTCVCLSDHSRDQNLCWPSFSPLQSFSWGQFSMFSTIQFSASWNVPSCSITQSFSRMRSCRSAEHFDQCVWAPWKEEAATSQCDQQGFGVRDGFSWESIWRRPLPRHTAPPCGELRKCWLHAAWSRLTWSEIRVCICSQCFQLELW